MYGRVQLALCLFPVHRDEDRRISRCDFGDARENTFQSGRCSNDLFEHEALSISSRKSDVFAPKPFFSLLSIFDVRRGNIQRMTCPLSSRTGL